mmetsp:Transcript_15771/g.36515  ORF Transcript_15771/g.36515 Transcript_15771/m.36515 type:complete len:414 (+) Transcript_15771:87-1328(+)
MANPVLIAAVEGGGTSFVVAVAEVSPRSQDNNSDNKIRILHRTVIDSSHDNPHQTLNECASFFVRHKNISKDGYRALGVGMFGPFGCDPERKEEYGTILTTTPKKNWRGVDVLSPLIKACESNTQKNLAVKIDTDVNAPAFAEYLSEKEKEHLTRPSENNQNQTPKKISSLAYVTIGTGVGVGLVIHGQPVHGKMHPEGGHVPVQPMQGDSFTGYSWGEKSRIPFKGRLTVESMASSVALTERLEQLQRQMEKSNSNLNLNRDCLAQIDDDNHELWDHAANALGNLCVTLALVTSVERIVLGGGIMERNGLIEKVRRQTRALLNGYLGELTDEDLVEWITLSRYGSDAGLVGALTLAQRAITENEEEIVVDSAKQSKQTAYVAGLWHGFILGISAVYFSLILRSRSGKSSFRQ